jgi:hypothetical protein
MDAVGEELERLARLRASGDLADEEYEILKARLIGLVDDDPVPNSDAEPSESPQSLDEIVVSPDGSEIQIPEDWGEDRAAVEFLRGRYRHEVSDHVHVVGPCIADDCVLNQVRLISANDWANLSQLPVPLKSLAQAASGHIPSLIKWQFKEVMSDDRKTRNVELTAYGHAFLACLAIVAYVMTERELFVEAFDGQRDMLLENAARFATSFCPALTSIGNPDHGDRGSETYWLAHFPELESVPADERRDWFDKPFYSPVDQVVAVYCGFKKMKPYDEHPVMESEFRRRLRGFQFSGADFRLVKERHRNDVEWTFKVAPLAIVVLHNTINIVGERMIPAFVRLLNQEESP